MWCGRDGWTRATCMHACLPSKGKLCSSCFWCVPLPANYLQLWRCTHTWQEAVTRPGWRFIIYTWSYLRRLMWIAGWFNTAVPLFVCLETILLLLLNADLSWIEWLLAGWLECNTGAWWKCLIVIDNVISKAMERELCGKYLWRTRFEIQGIHSSSPTLSVLFLLGPRK